MQLYINDSIQQTSIEKCFGHWFRARVWVKMLVPIGNQLFSLLTDDRDLMKWSLIWRISYMTENNPLQNDSIMHLSLNNEYLTSITSAWSLICFFFQLDFTCLFHRLVVLVQHWGIMAACLNQELIPNSSVSEWVNEKKSLSCTDTSQNNFIPFSLPFPGVYILYCGCLLNSVK
jgi:hypothetical protein